MFRIAILN